MTRRVLVSLCCAAALAATLSGCSNVRESLGMTREAPDEFRVVSRPPLAVPPDFRLRPPDPGAPPLQVGSASDMGRSAVTGTQSQPARTRDGASGGLSSGERALLSAAGADSADPSIRATVNAESASLAEGGRSFTDRLVFWREPEESGTLIDADAEARRIRERQAMGDSLTDGETPMIERRERGMFEGLFGRR